MLVRWDTELPRLNLPRIQMFGFLALPNLSDQTHLTFAFVDTLTAQWRIACEDQAEH